MTRAKIPIAKLITMNVAIALHTASDFVKSQIARMHNTEQAIRESVIIKKLEILTNFGFITPFALLLGWFSWLSIAVSVLFSRIRDHNANIPQNLRFSVTQHQRSAHLSCKE